MDDNLIIFGAGASVGSRGSSYFVLNNTPVEKSPPLGSKLFHELCQFNPDGWGKLSGEYSKLFEEDFESGMHHIAHSQTVDIALLQRTMAIYFFNFQVGKNSIYVKLAGLIKSSRWQGSIVTLNYERLLSQSLHHFGLNTTCSPELKNQNTIELCMPHGGCNIFCESIHASGNIQFSIGISTVGDIRIISNTKKYYQRITSDGIPPVMSYFEPKKRTLAGINFIDEQRRRYEELVSSANRIAIIGFRFREQDNHIWGPLKNTRANIIYCSGKNVEDISAWLKKNRTQYNDIVLTKYFNDGFEEICKFIKLYS